MVDPYALPETGPREPPKFTFMTAIAIIFAAFMVWQIGTTIAQGPAVLAASTIETGDTVEYDYTARLPDGTVHETTLLTVAQSANQTQGFPLEAPSVYVPARAIIGGSGLGWGPDADNALIDERVGRTITITVPPEHGIGDWADFTPGAPGINRELFAQPFQREIFLQEPAAAEAEGRQGTPGFDLAQLDQEIGPIDSGFVFNPERVFPPSWDIVFAEVNRDNKSILVRHTVQDGDAYTDTGLPGPVVATIQADESGTTTLAWRLDLEAGQQFVVRPQDALFQTGFGPGSYRVANVTDTHVGLLHHSSIDSAIIGQTLEIEITIRSIVEQGRGSTSSSVGSGPAGPTGSTGPSAPTPGGGHEHDDGHAHP